MIKTICKQRSDLSDYNIPVIINNKEKFTQINHWCFCEQSDELENDEYNVKILFIERDGNPVYAKSIDLEFDTMY